VLTEVGGRVPGAARDSPSQISFHSAAGPSWQLDGPYAREAALPSKLAGGRAEDGAGLRIEGRARLSDKREGTDPYG
jgi:hypothetical protein